MILGQEITLDGLCAYTAARLLMDIGQVNTLVLATPLPDPGFPGRNGYPPDFPHMVLGRGTGFNPKYRYPSDTDVRVPLAEIRDLMRQSGDEGWWRIAECIEALNRPRNGR